jgi:hypothetical protein
MAARYFVSENNWILVNIIETLENSFRIIPFEWNGFVTKEICVPKDRIEFIKARTV